MHWNLRTVVRLFLLVGGVLALASGTLGGSTTTLLVGAVAMGLGVVGLVTEWNESRT
ncbi:hypothetical protein [Natronobeatus ordinarius]|uniref:hypothetical protein n=1 Tax=Natronobeatus ordinarius TaxID=2963433 RepID=UPI0020CE1BA7|nr:hypothetical protein [Natronobeatus ordinarius]